MKDLVSQILTSYFKKMREPNLSELELSSELLEKKWSCFITLYSSWEVRWSAGNIKEIEKNLASELLKNTIAALTGDKRFAPLTLEEAEKLQFRIDYISERKIISEAELKKLDPVKDWVIAIKRDYEKLACILPNMSAKLMTWSDFIPVLLEKLEEKKFSEKNYILYAISTEVETNY